MRELEGLMAEKAGLDCQIEKYDSKEEWLPHRDLGASDAATIIGESPYKTPYVLWAEMTGLAPRDFVENEKMKWGNILEPVIARQFEDETGLPLVDLGRTTLCRSKEHSFMTATLDRLIAAPGEELEILEIKAVGAHMAEQWETEAPLIYQIQVQQQLYVTGLKKARIAALIGGQQLKWVTVERSEEFIDALKSAASEFWALVQSKTAPPIDGSAGAREVLKKLYPKPTPGVVVNLGEEFLALDSELALVNADLKRLEDRKSTIQNEIIAAIGEAEGGQLLDGSKWLYKSVDVKASVREVAAYSYRKLSRKAAK